MSNNYKLLENNNIKMSGTGERSLNSKSDGIAEESCIQDNLGDTAPARFECPICLAWLRDPVVTCCGHRFCRNCIQSWLEKETACPVDNMKLSKEDIFPDNFTRREISQQKTKCPNIVRGCLKDLSPLDVETHLLVCDYNPPEVHLPENEMLRCSFVDIGCDYKFEDEPQLQRHLQQDILKHLMLLTGAVRKFSLSSQSNSASAMAEEANFWDPPSKNDNVSGSDDLIKALYEKIVVLEQKSREQEIIIANMSEQISTNNMIMSTLSQRLCNGCYIWHVTDVKNKINEMKRNCHKMHYSPGFHTSYNGYRLCVRINLSPRDPNYIAILIHMMKTEHDNSLEWPFSGRISITIVHPNQSFRSIKETMMSKPELDAFRRPVQDLNPKGFGYTEFAVLDDLLTQDFIENNELIIRVIVQPV